MLFNKQNITIFLSNISLKYILVSVFEGNDLYFNSTFKEYFDEDFSKCSHGIENFIHIKTISLPGNHAFSEIQIQLNEKKFKFSHLSRPSLQLKKLIEFHIEQLGIKSFAEEPSMRNKSDNDDECRINFFAWMAETDPDKTVNISADYNHKGQEYRVSIILKITFVYKIRSYANKFYSFMPISRNVEISHFIGWAMKIYEILKTQTFFQQGQFFQKTKIYAL